MANRDAHGSVTVGWKSPVVVCRHLVATRRTTDKIEQAANGSSHWDLMTGTGEEGTLRGYHGRVPRCARRHAVDRCPKLIRRRAITAALAEPTGQSVRVRNGEPAAWPKRLTDMIERCLMVLGVFAFVLAPGGAQAKKSIEPSHRIAISPRSGPPGTVVTVKGSRCPPRGWSQYTWTVHVQTGHVDSSDAAGSGGVVQPSGEPRTPIGFTAEGYPGRVDVDTSPNKKGRWTARLVIPEQGHGTFPATPGTYPVTALCYAEEGAEAGRVNYQAGTFKVTAR